LADATANDLLDKSWVDACAIDDAFLDNAKKLACVKGGQTAVALAHGGTQCVDDYY
jgi:hypothetical protein